MPKVPDCTPIAYYRSGQSMRSRNVSEVLLFATIAVPQPPARLLADWQRDISTQLQLEPGDVEPLSLMRARARWPDYRQCVQAMSEWTQFMDLGEVLGRSEVALMASRGARYHHDGAQYGGMAFCNLFLSEDQGLDLHFPATNRRIPLCRGSVVVFDTAQPHAVVARGSSRFQAADFANPDRAQVFLSWELPLEDPLVARELQVAFDVDAAGALLLEDEQVWVNGAPALLCPESGHWLPHPNP